jgi:fluoroacetyl-CoA thioesterase
MVSSYVARDWVTFLRANKKGDKRIDFTKLHCRFHLGGTPMKDTLKPGIGFEFTFRLPATKTVPALYPESPEFQEMPEVFATGYLVGFLEWACIQAVNPHLDWPAEQTVGTHVDISHIAATPAGFDVTAKVKLVEVAGRRLVFDVEARDNAELISKGKHERFIINKDKFDSKMKEKLVRKIT